MTAPTQMAIRRRVVDEMLDRLARGASCTVRLQQYQDVLLRTSGKMLLNGTTMNVIGKKLGPGVYVVSLKEAP